jgi:hypothetical protein
VLAITILTFAGVTFLQLFGKVGNNNDKPA